MDHISVEDFQTTHDRDLVGQAPSLADHSSPPREPEEDYDPFSSPSPTAPHGSPPNEPIFDVPSHSSSPDTSPQHSEDEISVLLSNYQNQSRTASQQQQQQQHPSSPYTPLKIRPSGFRNPSSVRALQDTTPPHYHMTSPLSNRSKRGSSGSYFPTPSRKGTPRSSQRSPSKLSPSKKPATAKKEYPLILLHVTLLPIPTPYSKAVMEHVLPPYILQNWKLLSEKVTSTVLERGILIPHPREDYDLLEERLLESLELRMPRILACGHFHLDPHEEAELLAAAAASEEIEDEDTDDDADICTDCGRRVRDGRYGAGSGSRRWDIKLFAANGLMRAGAWGAAWREMERVDVEICPWVGEDLQRELERAREAEEQEHALRRAEEEEGPPETGLEDDDNGDTRSGPDTERMREIYGDDHYLEARRPSSSPTITHADDLPLSTLLLNYLTLLSRDPRNIAIALLSLLILALAIRSTPPPPINSELTTSFSSPPPLAPSITSPAFSGSSVVPPIATGSAEGQREAEGDSTGAGFPMEDIEATFEFDG